MKIAEKIKGLVQSKEDEQNTMIIKGVKYKAVENGWVPILNVPTIRLIDCSKTES
jgi:hypothetical protein